MSGVVTYIAANTKHSTLGSALESAWLESAATNEPANVWATGEGHTLVAVVNAIPED